MFLGSPPQKTKKNTIILGGVVGPVAFLIARIRQGFSGVNLKTNFPLCRLNGFFRTSPLILTIVQPMKNQDEPDEASPRKNQALKF